MKKIYKYIMTVAIVLMGLLQFTSCNDANEWTADSSALRQRQPSSFKVELKDVKTLQKEITIGTVAGATSYEIQMSTAPLSSNGNVPEGAEINTSIVNMTAEGDLELDEESAKLPTFEQGKTYYFRVRAIGEDGTKSNWYTNGSVYNGGVSDATLEQKLIENTYKYDSDKNSYSVVTVPTLAWIDGADVDADALTVHWHEIKYAKIKYLRNEADPENLIDISSADPDPASDGSEFAYNENTRAYHHTVDKLKGETEYTFSILAEDGTTVLGTATASTEATPDMSLALFIGGFDEIVQYKATDFELNSVDANGNESTAFSAKFNFAGSKVKTESKKGTDNPYYNPIKETFYPLTYLSSETNGNRISTGGKTSGKVGSIELNIPAKGRLYIYGTIKANQPFNITQTVKNEDGEDVTVTTKLSSPTAVSKNPATTFTKAYVEKGTATITWEGSEYLCGMHFVPWEEIPAADTPSADQPTE